MTHEIKLIGSNIVLAANSFDVEALDIVWLYNNGIFLEEEKNQKTSIGMVTQIVNDDFKFDLFSDRLQFAIHPNVKASKKLINEKMKKLVKLIKTTKITAAGLNFLYEVSPSDGNLHKFTRNLFFNEKSNFLPAADDSTFYGFQYSKDELETRLKFEAKPITVMKNNDLVDVIIFSYNFNSDIGQGDDYNKIIKLLDKWTTAKKLSKELTYRINING